MLYFKPIPSGFAFIDLTWMDIIQNMALAKNTVYV